MPSRIIHYCVASGILKEINLNKELFLLGNLAPDAHDNTKEGNYKSHFRIPKSERVTNYLDTNSFKSKYMKYNFDDLMLGYYCHLITDNLWLMDMYKRYVKNQSKEEKEQRSRQCYKDYKVLNGRLIKHFELEKIAIKIPKTIGIYEIQNNFLQDVINKMNHFSYWILKLF